MIKHSSKQIESLKQFMGPERDIYPDWYINYLAQPWVDFFVPEITPHFDEIVENALFGPLIIQRYKLGNDVQVIGSNRHGQQAFIVAGDHENIHLIYINNHSRQDYHDTEICDLPNGFWTVHWRVFREEVVRRPPKGRFDK